MPTPDQKHRVVTADEQIDAAIARGRLVPSHRVVAATYDERADEIALRFQNGTRLAVPRQLLQGLTDAAPAQLHEIQIVGPGTGLRWPKLNVAHYVPGLIDGVFGTRKWMSEIGRLGGATRSPAKAAASRANGAKGGWPKGRPRKVSSKPAALPKASRESPITSVPGPAEAGRKKVAPTRATAGRKKVAASTATRKS
jgi:hypothetical protein